jgi:hypothetical protein
VQQELPNVYSSGDADERLKLCVENIYRRGGTIAEFFKEQKQSFEIQHKSPYSKPQSVCCIQTEGH